MLLRRRLLRFLYGLQWPSCDLRTKSLRVAIFTTVPTLWIALDPWSGLTDLTLTDLTFAAFCIPLSTPFNPTLRVRSRKAIPAFWPLRLLPLLKS